MMAVQDIGSVVCTEYSEVQGVGENRVKIIECWREQNEVKIIVCWKDYSVGDNGL